MHIFVGSTNPVKINAVVQAASETWPEVRVTGLDVPSDVKAQPLSDDETYQGARNRAIAVLNKGRELHSPQAAQEVQLGVGLEGGVFERGSELWTTVWAVVVDESGAEWSANGSRFPVPELVAEQIRQGGEMGPIVSELIGEAEVRQKQGMIGVITEGFLDRTEEYSAIAKMALGLWYGRNWAARLA